MNKEQKKEIQEIIINAVKEETHLLWERFIRLNNPNVVEKENFNTLDPWDVFYWYSEIIWVLEKRSADLREYTNANHYGAIYDLVSHFFLGGSKTNSHKKQVKKFIKLWIKQNQERIYNVSAQIIFHSLIEWLDQNNIEYNKDYSIYFSFEIN